MDLIVFLLDIAEGVIMMINGSKEKKSKGY